MTKKIRISQLIAINESKARRVKLLKLDPNLESKYHLRNFDLYNYHPVLMWLDLFDLV